MKLKIIKGCGQQAEATEDKQGRSLLQGVAQWITSGKLNTSHAVWAKSPKDHQNKWAPTAEPQSVQHAHGANFAKTCAPSKQDGRTVPHNCMMLTINKECRRQTEATEDKQEIRKGCARWSGMMPIQVVHDKNENAANYG